jgi:hypothetical protein
VPKFKGEKPDKVPARLGRPPTRPNPLDPGIVERICEGLIEGNSIVKVCEPEDMPHYTMVYRTMAKDPDFAKEIARAREAQQEAIIDKTVDLADNATAEDWQVVKLRIWARQWRAAKLAPKKYGDRTHTEITGAGGGPVQVQALTIDARDLMPEHREALKQALLAAKNAKEA